MNGEQVRDYIENELDSDPIHDVDALASAIKDTSIELEYDSFELMRLLLENKPIPAIHTHSYGFHTANGRKIIETIQDKYYGITNAE